MVTLEEHFKYPDDIYIHIMRFHIKMKHNHNEHYVRLHSVDVIVFDLDF